MLEDVVHEEVEDGHRLVGDNSVRVRLLEHCEMDIRQFMFTTNQTQGTRQVAMNQRSQDALSICR